MAIVFFAREGSDPNRANQGQYVDMQIILEHFSNSDIRYSKNPPIINSHKNPTPYSRYTLTVVEVEEGETNDKFTEPGYYWLCRVAPKECAELLSLLSGEQ